MGRQFTGDGREGIRVVQREKLSRDAVSRKASADLTGVPKMRSPCYRGQGAELVFPGCGMSLEGVVISSKVGLFS